MPVNAVVPEPDERRLDDESPSSLQPTAMSPAAARSATTAANDLGDRREVVIVAGTLSGRDANRAARTLYP
jgi:hypothetical protein